MERIRDEFTKILTADFFLNGIQKIYDLGLWKSLFKNWRFQMNEYKKHFYQPIKDPDKAWFPSGLIATEYTPPICAKI